MGVRGSGRILGRRTVGDHGGLPPSATERGPLTAAAGGAVLACMHVPRTADKLDALVEVIEIKEPQGFSRGFGYRQPTTLVSKLKVPESAPGTLRGSSREGV